MIEEKETQLARENYTFWFIQNIIAREIQEAFKRGRI